MPEGFDYKGDVEINENDLDGEWIKQASLYANWAVRYAKELRLKDIIWLKKKVLKATLYNKYRVELTVNDKAPTDTRVDSAVRSDAEYEKVSLELIDTEARVNELDAIKWAMEHKKKSLDRLSENQDKAFNMPDGYKERREKAIQHKQEESEELDRMARKAMKRKEMGR
ncbi:MAG: hypothetical protein PHO27_12200 [Sulfuricurvum sp.]|jgi:hypothetical protein|nr:hypothetical protein [Sulfuricurvum sp.]